MCFEVESMEIDRSLVYDDEFMSVAVVSVLVDYE